MNIKRKFRNAVKPDELLNPWPWELYGKDIPTVVSVYGGVKGTAQVNMLCLIFLGVFKVV